MTADSPNSRPDRAGDGAEERYRLLLENANDAVYVHELSPERPGRFLEVNERACAMLGYTADELLAMEVTEIDVPEQRERLSGIIGDLYETGRALFETEHLARDGRRVPVEVSTHLFDLHGRPTVLSVVRDVTARRQAEAQLRAQTEEIERQKEFLATLLDTIPLPVFYKDGDGRYVGCNHAYAELVGRPPEEIAGKTATEVSGEELGRKYEEMDRRLLEHPGTQTYQTPFPAADGEIVEMAVHKATLDDTDGVASGIIGVMLDITERKRANEALQRSEQRHVTFLNATDDIAFLKDDRLRYLFVNQANADFLGRPIDEIVGRTDEELMDADAAAGCRSSDLRALEEGGTVLVEERVDDRIYEVHKFPVALEGGHIGVGGYARDVTERERAAAALEQSAGRLRAALHDTVRAMGEVVGLRDPYTAHHEKNVTRLALAIAAELGLEDDVREGLMLAGEVHDIGKIAVPAEILSKPSALTKMELRIVQQHPVVGRDVLAGIDFHQPVAKIVGQHHERLDGSGYPDGLRGDGILPEARILAVADVVEAMASHRPYRPALGVKAAMEEVRAGAGSRYDADAVAACERVIESGFDIVG